MRKWLRGTAAALALVALNTGFAETDWTAAREIRCADHRQNCRLLQTVMMGSYDALSTEDALSVRVFSAVLPMLSAVTEDDFAHFAAEFGEDEQTVLDRYREALANCLWADILLSRAADGQLTAAQRVLLLFLDPESQSDAEAQMAEIRANLTDEVLSRLADATGVPADFVRWLIEKPD